MINPAINANSMRMIIDSIVVLPLQSNVHVAVSFVRGTKNLICIETPDELKYATLHERMVQSKGVRRNIVLVKFLLSCCIVSFV